MESYYFLGIILLLIVVVWVMNNDVIQLKETVNAKEVTILKLENEIKKNKLEIDYLTRQLKKEHPPK